MFSLTSVQLFQSNYMLEEKRQSITFSIIHVQSVVRIRISISSSLDMTIGSVEHVNRTSQERRVWKGGLEMPKIGKHKKLCYIECAYWSCSYQHIELLLEKDPRVKVCIEHGVHKNLIGHRRSNAPKWCQRRRENGGNNV